MRLDARPCGCRPTRFAEAMDALAELGKVEQQSRKSEDVTTQVIDNDARVRAQRSSA